MPSKQKILITAALPYANGPLHFGHIAGAYLPADCFARFERLQGNDVLFVCGSDEYGAAITYSAHLADRTPRDHVDFFHKKIKDFFHQLNLSFDHYSRTTWEGHTETVQEFFLSLLKNGHIEERVTEQLYSPKDNQFLADRYVVGTCPSCGFEEARGDECTNCGASYDAIDLIDPRSKLSGAPMERKKTKHWFLRYDHFKEKLMEWIKQKPWKKSVLHFAKHYIENLLPRPITRDLDWGIPIPLKGTEGKVLYVWFDAPIGYISATKEWAEQQGDAEAWKKYWLDPQTRYVQFIGKDNIPFHAIFFPAMIMGQNIPYKIVDDLPANEFYHLEGRQFSKSEGWYIDIERFFKKFSVDQARYSIAANAPESQDSEFSWTDFQHRCNAELLGKFANFAHRTLTFVRKHYEDKIPAPGKFEEEERAFEAQIKELASQAADAYAHFSLRKAAAHIMELATVGNVYFDRKQPWKVIKESQGNELLAAPLYLCLECLKLLALISYPIIPATAEKLWAYLGFKTPLTTWDEIVRTPLKPQTYLPEPHHLFRKIEDKEIDEEKRELSDTLKKAKKEKKGLMKEQKPQVSKEEFDKLDIRVGKIQGAEPVPESKKLIKFTIDLGGETRTIVSGILEFVPDLSGLLGKNVLVVVNLKPIKIMGIESQGLLITAEEGEDLELPSVLALKPGAKVS